MSQLLVAISDVALTPGVFLDTLYRDAENTGAVASFTGHVRGAGISAMALEHYPGMTESAILQTLRSAARRWPIHSARVVHRVGELRPGDPIVWIGVASAHRGAAFTACEFVMDYLKISAPLWKRECDLQGKWRWVEARLEDRNTAERWTSVQEISTQTNAEEAPKIPCVNKAMEGTEKLK